MQAADENSYFEEEDIHDNVPINTLISIGEGLKDAKVLRITNKKI
jgi:hypothetical protein